MKLNPDVYYDFIQEAVDINNKNKGFLSKFMLSGNKSLIVAKTLMQNVDSIIFLRYKRDIRDQNIRYFMKLHWVRI